MLTVEYLRSRLSYDPDTGEFRWLPYAGMPNNWAARFVGKIAGSPKPENRIIIRLRMKPYKAHRLAWLYMTGEWPEEEVDHWDGDGYNNRWCNLREATSQQQNFNQRVHKDSKSGIKGVQRNVKGLWFSRIHKCGRTIHLGTFLTSEAAAEAYNKAAKEYQREFAVSNRPKTKE